MGRRMMAVAAAAALLGVGGSARAVTTFTVDSTADTPGDCGVGGQCTLRAAVRAANAAGGSNVVTLPAGTYTLTAGALVVTGTLELDGAGAGTTVIDGGGVDSVFDASTADGLSISGVRITGGNAPDASGGAILVNADTTLTKVTLDHNSTGQRVVAQRPVAGQRLSAGELPFLRLPRYDSGLNAASVGLGLRWRLSFRYPCRFALTSVRFRLSRFPFLRSKGGCIS